MVLNPPQPDAAVPVLDRAIYQTHTIRYTRLETRASLRQVQPRVHGSAAASMKYFDAKQFASEAAQHTCAHCSHAIGIKDGINSSSRRLLDSTGKSKGNPRPATPGMPRSMQETFDWAYQHSNVLRPRCCLLQVQNTVNQIHARFPSTKIAGQRVDEQAGSVLTLKMLCSQPRDEHEPPTLKAQVSRRVQVACRTASRR